MTSVRESVAAASELIAATRRSGRRLLLAVAGPPGAGKSTLSQALAADLAASGERAALLPLDGFHLDNRLLEARGLLARKGAPETFDAEGFGRALDQARDGGADLVHPVFDRARDLAVAGAGVVSASASVVIVEGAYLLLDEPPWRARRRHFDATIFLHPGVEELQRRLIDRWIGYGHDRAAAAARARGNDMANARRVIAGSAPADLRLGAALDS